MTATQTAASDKRAEEAAAKLAAEEAAAKLAAAAAAEEAAAKLAAAAAAEEAAVIAAIDVDKLTAVPAVREPAYRIADGSPRLPFGKQQLCLGTAVKAGHSSYVLVNGTAQTGFPTAAVAIAIRDGLISRDTVRALWAAADSQQ